MNSTFLYRFWRPNEMRKHPGDLPPANRPGKVTPTKPSPNQAPRGKRKRIWS